MSFQNSVNTLYQKLSAVLRTERSWFRKIIRAIWILFFVFVFGLPLYVFTVIKNPFNLFGGMPSFADVENPTNDLSSEVISADGISLGRYFRFNRSQVSYDELPLLLVRTLLISEDHRFRDHAGIDYKSYLRVVKGVFTGANDGGGSTLTQQTAKNLFNTREDELQGSLANSSSFLKLLISKTKELIIAVKLEENFTKEEIIALYLNTVPFNNNSYGIKIAAETYFSKRLDQLTIPETCLLIGMLQGTNTYNPVAHPVRALKKRNDVLFKLYKHNVIKNKLTLDSMFALSLGLNFSVQSQNLGIATYFRSVLKNELNTWCKENGYDLQESGLKIYTTIDSRMQMAAEESMRQHMKKLQGEFTREWKNRNPWGGDEDYFLNRKIKRTEYYKELVKHYGENSDSIDIVLKLKHRMTVFAWNGPRDTLFSQVDSLQYYNRFLQCGLMSMNPLSGEVKAWVGGNDHTFFKFDHVKQSKRQPGSTFKPFVYGKAMEDGYSPCQPFEDISPDIKVNGVIYKVENSEGGYGSGDIFTLRQALARSLNTITVQLMDKLRPENVAEFAHRAGIVSKLDPVISLALGTSNVSLQELVAAYSGFVNLGMYTEPYYITRIEDKYGNVVAQFIPHTKQAMNAETADKIIYLLRGGIEEEHGTSRSMSTAVKNENQVGGKTGTTDNASDGWYVGITHNLVTGVWVGGDEPGIHFPSWSFGSGAHSALPIWDHYMQAVYADPQIGYKKGIFRHADTSSYHECDTIPDEEQEKIF